MAKAINNSKVFDELAKLKRHLRSCSYCMAAKRASSPEAMCQAGTNLTFAAAMRYDDLIRLRTQAHNRPGGVVYACPDLSKHGFDYSVTATPLIVTGVQDRLF